MILISACVPTGETASTATPTAFPTLFMTRTPLPTATAVPTIKPTSKPLSYLTVLNENDSITIRNIHTNLVIVIKYVNVNLDIIMGYYNFDITLNSILSHEVKVSMSNRSTKKLSDIDPWYEGIQLDTSFTENIRIQISEDWIVVE